MRKADAGATRDLSLLRTFVANCTPERIVAGEERARAALAAMRNRAAQLLDGGPDALLDLRPGRGRPSTARVDRDIALHVHSERILRRRSWKVVTRNVNAWLRQQATNGPAVRPGDRDAYRRTMTLEHLDAIYRKHRALAEAWDLMLPDLTPDEGTTQK